MEIERRYLSTAGVLLAACRAVVAAASFCWQQCCCLPMSIASSGGTAVTNSAAVVAAPLALTVLACRCHRSLLRRCLLCICCLLISQNIGMFCTVFYRFITRCLVCILSFELCFSAIVCYFFVLFCFTAPLMPLSDTARRVCKVDFWVDCTQTLPKQCGKEFHFFCPK